MFKTNITISQWSSQNSPTVTHQPAAPQPQPVVLQQAQPLIVQAQPSHVLVSVPQAYPSAAPIQLVIPQIQSQVQPQLYQTQLSLYQTQPPIYQTQPSLYQTQPFQIHAQLPPPQIQNQPSLPQIPPSAPQIQPTVTSTPSSPPPQLSAPQAQTSLIQTQVSVSQTQLPISQAQVSVSQPQPSVAQASVPQIQASAPQLQYSNSALETQPSTPQTQPSNASGDFPKLKLFPGKANAPIGKKSGDVKSQPAWAQRSNTKSFVRAQSLKKLQEPQKEDKQALSLKKEYKTLKFPYTISGFKSPMLKKNSSNAPSKSSPTVIPSSISTTNTKAGVPESWLAALRENVNISELITDGDAGALEHLRDIRVTIPDDEALNFQLHFYFDANDFFTDSELTKTYYFSYDGDSSSEENDSVSVRAEGCEIHWKENKDLTKNTNDTTPVYKFDCFFDLFSSPTVPSDEDLEKGNVDEEDLEILQNYLQLHCQIGEELKEKIIPLVADYLSEKAPEYEAIDSNTSQKKDEKADGNGKDSRGDDVKDAPASNKRNIFSLNLSNQNNKFPSLSRVC